MKYHFIDLLDDIKLIIGMNGMIWIYYSTITNESEYFSDDFSKIQAKNVNEVNNFFLNNLIIIGTRGDTSYEYYLI